jgi:hypothetical protein
LPGCADEVVAVSAEAFMSELSTNEPPEQRRDVNLQARTVPADDSPVPAGPATISIGARPFREPGRLVLLPFWSFRRSLILLIIVTGLGVVWALLIGDALAQPLVLAIVLVPWTLIWAWVLYSHHILPRVTFDQEAGLLILGWKGIRGRRPLSSVIGVQVMETRKQFGGPEANIPALTLYQLNLILDDPAERRLNVTTCDPLTARSNARQIADFLDVPVLDSAGSPTAAADNAEVTAIACFMIPSPVVIEKGPDVLLIRSHRLAFLMGGQWRALVSIAVLLGVVTVQGPVPSWGIIAIAVAFGSFLFMAVLANLRCRAQFDRERGVLKLGWRGHQEPRSLASLKAVEVVAGTEYRLNLLVDDSSRPHLNLIIATEAPVVRRTAERLASFLGVPLRETRPRTPGGVQTSALGGPGFLEKLSRSPVPPGKATVRGPACVAAKGDDVLIVRPRTRFWARFLPSLLTICVALVVGWLADPAGLGPTATWLGVALLTGMFLFSVRRLLIYWNQFDKRAGLLTRGWVSVNETYPLEKILAVQLIPGGLIAKTSDLRGGECVSYQLNLVMADVYEDRLNLTDIADLEWTRLAGQQVADFLGVPVIDQIAEDA